MSYELFEKAAAVNGEFQIIPTKINILSKGIVIDKNTLNTRLDNLMLISRDELVRLNQKYTHIDGSLKQTALLAIKISKEIRKKEKAI